MKIHLPAFEPMAKCNESQRHGPIDIDLGPDVVPVTRCKDCKYGRQYDKLMNRWECTRFLGSLPIREDDYCSYGVRKEDK